MALVAMEEYETRRGPALSSPQRGRDARALAEAQAEAEANAEVETQLAPGSTELPQCAAKVRTKAVCEAKRRQKWLPSGDHHLLTLTTSGLVSKTQRKSPTGGVC